MPRAFRTVFLRDSNVEVVNDEIDGDMLDPDWVKSVYYAIYLESKFEYQNGMIYSFVLCFTKDISSSDDSEKKRAVKTDKTVLFSDIGKMLGIKITDSIKNRADEI
jgi:hypothetical protein